jgi:hypothetical protein
MAYRVISEEQMQHGRPWRGEDVTEWFASEKLDGCADIGTARACGPVLAG